MSDFNEDYEDLCFYRDIPIYRKWDREKRRKERGNFQHEEMLKRYDEKCGECIIVQPAKVVK